MVEIMKQSDRSERYEAPPPPTSTLHHHHVHHHPLIGTPMSGPVSGLVNHPPHMAGIHHSSLPRPMPPLPANGANGSPLQRHGMHPMQQHTFQNGSAVQVGGGLTTARDGSTATTVNGVTVLNGQAPYDSETESEKWWWVCCLEFCFCLL